MAVTKSSKKAIHIRVMADLSIVKQIADQLSNALEQDGLHDLVESSEVHPCRAPNTDQGRVYITFVRRPE